MRAQICLLAFCCLLGFALVGAANGQAIIAQTGFNTAAAGIQDPTPYVDGADLVDLFGTGAGGTGLGWVTTWGPLFTVFAEEGVAAVTQSTTKLEDDMALHTTSLDANKAVVPNRLYDTTNTLDENVVKFNFMVEDFWRGQCYSAKRGVLGERGRRGLRRPAGSHSIQLRCCCYDR